jgi:hypothetical protein
MKINNRKPIYTILYKQEKNLSLQNNNIKAQL